MPLCKNLLARFEFVIICIVLYWPITGLIPQCLLGCICLATTPYACLIIDSSSPKICNLPRVTSCPISIRSWTESGRELMSRAESVNSDFQELSLRSEVTITHALQSKQTCMHACIPVIRACDMHDTVVHSQCFFDRSQEKRPKIMKLYF